MILQTVKQDLARIRTVGDVADAQDTFGTRLAAARKAKGLSRKTLERLSGVPERSIAAYESEGVDPSLSAAARLADRLGVALDDLAGITPPSERRRGARDVAAPESVMLALLRSLDGRLSQLERALTERGAPEAPGQARRAG